MNQELTFAEAMALDPSEVEWFDGVVWRSLADNGEYPLDYLRSRTFRRARPKRSRVQEMADAFPAQLDRSTLAPLHHMTTAIRAVCEFIRTKSRGYKDHDAQVAEEIEREFLEPR